MSRESIETLVAELIHEEDWRRMRATAACLSGGPKAVTALIQATEQGAPALKAEAAAMLARVKDPRAGVPLVRMLTSDESTVRQAGAQALSQMAGVLDREAATVLVHTLSDVTDDETRKMIMTLVGAVPTAIDPLCELVRNGREDAQVTAATMLEHLLEPRSADALVDAMGRPALTQIAVRTLQRLGAVRERIDGAMNALRDVEGSIEREDARMSTVIALLGIGRPAVEILIEYLDDDDWVVREAAADLLGKIGDVRAVPALMERLEKDKDTGVKEHAIKSLGLIGDARPVQLYIEAIPVRPLRVFAMEALAKIKEVEVLRPQAELFERLKTDRDGLVSYNAGLIVDKLAALAEAQAAQAEEAATGG
ncbi:MAG: HEAT repeat domain-containing protein [Nitrospiraceae bacterium]